MEKSMFSWKRTWVVLLPCLYIVTMLVLRPSTSRISAQLFDAGALLGGALLMVVCAVSYYSWPLYLALNMAIGALTFPGLMTRMDAWIIPFLLWCMYAAFVTYLGYLIKP